MTTKKECFEKSKYCGITGSEIARILNSGKIKSKEESREYILSHASFCSKHH